MAELVGGAFGHDAAARDDHDAVAECRDLGEDVAREDHAAALVAQVPQQGAHRPDGHHVEAVGGLVQQHVGRVVHQRAGDADLHPLALREAGGAAVGDLVEPEAIDQGAHAEPQRVAGQPLEPAEVDEVLARCEPRVEAFGLGEHADAGLDGCLCCADAVDLHAAAIGAHQGGDHAQGGGLASAVGAQDAGDGAVAGDEGHVVDCHHSAKLASQPARLDHRARLTALDRRRTRRTAGASAASRRRCRAVSRRPCR